MLGGEARDVTALARAKDIILTEITQAINQSRWQALDLTRRQGLRSGVVPLSEPT